MSFLVHLVGRRLPSRGTSRDQLPGRAEVELMQNRQDSCLVLSLYFPVFKIRGSFPTKVISEPFPNYPYVIMDLNIFGKFLSIFLLPLLLINWPTFGQWSPLQTGFLVFAIRPCHLRYLTSYCTSPAQTWDQLFLPKVGFLLWLKGFQRLWCEALRVLFALGSFLVSVLSVDKARIHIFSITFSIMQYIYMCVCIYTYFL